MTSPVLSIDNLVVRYPGVERPTLDGLTLVLNSGERLALVGPSGCGKSTVARAVLQLLPPSSQCSGGLLLTGQDPSLLRRSAFGLRAARQAFCRVSCRQRRAARPHRFG